MLPSDHDVQGTISYQSPSNIALIKYWGKKDIQIPRNPSISFTLSRAHTNTSITYQPKQNATKWIEFSFEGKEEKSFALRIENFLKDILPIFPFLSQLNLKIESHNSFPHSSGIASSASSMSALALGLCSIERYFFNTLSGEEDFLQKASFVARLGSGSACRSVYPHLAIWGKAKDVDLSSDYYAIPYNDVHPSFLSFHDDVLIISAEKKSVSSTVGHGLMNDNPFAKERYVKAHQNLQHILMAMKKGDLEHFGRIVEEEALMLHALMMCSKPSFILMKPNTLQCIEEIRQYRQETKVPIYFTLDAGPNVHVLYPQDYQVEVSRFINERLLPLTESNVIINDRVGSGPKQL